MPLCCQLLERSSVGAPGAGFGAAAARQAHLVEQDFAELLGRADIEILAGKLPDLVFEPRDGLGERTGEARERGPLDLDAGALHLGEHRRKWTLQGLID